MIHDFLNHTNGEATTAIMNVNLVENVDDYNFCSTRINSLFVLLFLLFK